jgi:formate dehydrogenase subunit gamma
MPTRRTILRAGATEDKEKRMATLFAKLRFAAGALALLALVAIAIPASAQQRNPDSSVNPTASSVNEQQLLRELNRVQGRISIPDTKEGTLIQPQGREWRFFHEVILHWFGAVAILGILLVLTGFYLWRGMVRIEKGRSGRTVVRFNAFERFVHWMTASCFIVLAISGLNITFGKTVLLPLFGPGAFTTWSQALKYAHNFLSFPFTLGVIVIALMWIAGNIPNRIDLQWLKRGGGIVGNDHPPAYRFNAGQKAIYWIVVLGGAAVAISGYVLMFPFYGPLTIQGMQLAQIVHALVGVLFICAMLGHIYIGTIGMEGAFEAMGTGDVDVNWAEQHHKLWLDEEHARTGPNETRRQPAATPAE